jgi:hypothetical protein
MPASTGLRVDFGAARASAKAMQKALVDKWRDEGPKTRVTLDLPEEIWDRALCHAGGDERAARRALVEVLLHDLAADDICREDIYEEYDPSDAIDRRNLNDAIRSGASHIRLAPSLLDRGAEIAAIIEQTVRSIHLGPEHSYGVVWIEAVGTVTWRIEDEEPDLFSLGGAVLVIAAEDASASPF